MIRLWGPPQSALYRAAQCWRAHIRAAWPGAEAGAGYDIHLVAEAEVPGDAGPRRLDLVIMGLLAEPQLVAPAADAPTGGSALNQAPVTVGSFCAVVTVAAVPPAQVEWQGDHLGVVAAAGRPWRDLLDHSRTQRRRLRAFLEAALVTVPAPILHRHLSIAPLIWLPEVVPDDLLVRFPPPWLRDPQAERRNPNSPILCRNVLYGDATWPDFLGKVGRHWPEQRDFGPTRALRVLPAPYELAFPPAMAALARCALA